MGLSPNVHPLINGFLSWKVVSIQGGRIGRRHFHHLAMNSYLHQKNITLKKDNIIYPMKQKYLCDYDPRCIISSCLMFDDIIMGTIKRSHIIGEFMPMKKQHDFLYGFKSQCTSIN